MKKILEIKLELGILSFEKTKPSKSKTLLSSISSDCGCGSGGDSGSARGSRHSKIRLSFLFRKYHRHSIRF